MNGRREVVADRGGQTTGSRGGDRFQWAVGGSGKALEVDRGLQR